MFKSSLRVVVWILTLLSSVASFGADRAPLIISDVDDTVKLANVPHPLPAVTHGVFGEGIFPGMPELYTAMARDPDSMIFLSGGPTLLKSHVKDELDDAAFPPYRLLMRNIFKKGNSTPVHKRARLEELLVANPDTPFILIGDDGEKDPETLSGFATAHSGKAVAVYIHRVLARAIPAGITSYNTAFEIALNEFNAGRMTAGEAAVVGEAVLAAKPKLVFPKFVECPKSISYPASTEIAHSAILTDLITKNQAHFAAFCASR
jgi:phosphatidate phosphatase APP1